MVSRGWITGTLDSYFPPNVLFSSRTGLWFCETPGIFGRRRLMLTALLACQWITWTCDYKTTIEDEFSDHDHPPICRLSEMAGIST